MNCQARHRLSARPRPWTGSTQVQQEMRRQAFPGLACTSVGLLVALASLGIGSGSASAAPPQDPGVEGAFTCGPATAANEIPAPPPIWELSGKPPSAEEVAYADATKPLCPTGQVPSPIASGSAAPLLTPTSGGVGIGELGATSERRAVPPAYSGKRCYTEGPWKGGCYWYVENEVKKNAIGMEYITNVSEPRVSSFPGAHSIDQLNLGAGGPGDDHNTIEAGIDVAPEMFGGSQKPHFFYLP